MSVIPPYDLGLGEITPGSIRATWSNGETYDEIQLRYAPGTTISLPGTDTEKVIEGLSENTLYTVDVRGRVDAAWSDWSVAVQARTTLKAPTGLSATNIINGKTTLSWINNTSNQSHLVVEYSNDGITYYPLPAIPGYPTSVEVSAGGGGDWYFRIIAWNQYTSNFSAYEGPIQAGYPLPAPQNLLVTPLSSTTARADWTDTSEGELGFKIELSTDGIEFSQIDVVGPGVETYPLTGLTPGVKVWIRVRAYDGTGDGFYSNIATVTPVGVAMPTNIEAYATPTTITVTWVDNSNNELWFKIYIDGVLAYTTGPNETSHLFTGMTPATWYKIEIEAGNATDSSGLSEDIRVFTADPPAAPSDLVLVVVSAYSIRANWKDNSDNETAFKIELSSNGTDFDQIDTVGANIQTYLITGLSSNSQYWVRVRAANDSGNSAYSAVANAVTFAAIAKPTNLSVQVMRIGGVMYNEGRFDDNSAEEDGHEIERKVDLGDWTVIGTLPPNKYFFYDSDITLGHVYQYAVRAKQGASYSAYSNTATAYPNSSGGYSLVLLDSVQRYPDKLSMNLLGDHNAVCFQLEQSPNGSSWSKIADIPYGACKYFTAAGLDPGKEYYFRLKNIYFDGSVSYSATTTESHTTTPTEYIPTEFEKLCLIPKKPITYLVEANPLLELKGWELTAGKTYTYEHAVEYPEIEIDTITENGIPLTKYSSIASVEAYSGSWYHDYHGGKVYVHPSGNNTPGGCTYLGSTWLYFTNWQRGATIYSDRPYLPLIPPDGLPSITQKLEKYYKGSFVVTHGSISFINGKAAAWRRRHYFDERGSTLIWLNRPVRVKAGGENFDYEDFETLATGEVTGTSIDDSRFTISLRDHRGGLHRSLPLRKYSLLDFPNLYSGAVGGEGSGDVPRPFYLGACTHVAPVCIDTVNKIFELHDGRITSVEEVTLNSVVLTAGTDYYIDYGLGRIVLAKTIAYSSSDTLLVSFTGAAWRDGTAIDQGPWIFFYILTGFMGLTLNYDTDINMASIFEAAALCPEHLAVKIYKETTTEEVIELLEKSCLAYSFQDSRGRIGFRVDTATVPSEVAYLPEQRIIEIGRNDSIEDIYAEVHVHYDEWPTTQRYRWIKKEANTFLWKFGVLKRLDIYSAHATESNALALGDKILAILNKPSYPITTTRIFMPRQVGDKFYLTRRRFFDSQGTANARLMRITEISKNPGAATVSIRAEAVLS